MDIGLRNAIAVDLGGALRICHRLRVLLWKDSQLALRLVSLADRDAESDSTLFDASDLETLRELDFFYTTATGVFHQDIRAVVHAMNVRLQGELVVFDYPVKPDSPYYNVFAEIFRTPHTLVA